MSQAGAGLLAGVFGFMNLFARALGGIASDRIGRRAGLRGKGILLGILLFTEGVGLILFAMSGNLSMAIVMMLFFALSLHMANGATYGIVPFVNEKNVGLVSGIVGAGGNMGGMAFGFLFKSKSISYVQAFTFIGFVVIAISIVVLATKFYKVKSAEKMEGAHAVAMA